MPQFESTVNNALTFRELGTFFPLCIVCLAAAKKRFITSVPIQQIYLDDAIEIVIERIHRTVVSNNFYSRTLLYLSAAIVWRVGGQRRMCYESNV